MNSPKIFISYRRSDSASVAGRINDHLAMQFGQPNVFKDSYTIQPGDDFRGRIHDGIGQCEIVLVVIGPTWLKVTEENNPGLRRLDNPNDWVRIEVETALQRAANGSTRVIPLLVGGASMPSPNDLPATLRELAPKNAVTIREDPDFKPDMERLIAFLRSRIDDQPAAAATPAARFQGDTVNVSGGVVGAVVQGGNAPVQVTQIIGESPQIKTLERENAEHEREIVTLKRSLERVRVDLRIQKDVQRHGRSGEQYVVLLFPVIGAILVASVVSSINQTLGVLVGIVLLAGTAVWFVQRPPSRQSLPPVSPAQAEEKRLEEAIQTYEEQIQHNKREIRRLSENVK